MLKKLQEGSLDEIELPEKINKEIVKVGEKRGLNKEQLRKLEEEVKKVYLMNRFEPGEAIGIITAQSISEPSTQMCCEYNEKIIVKYPEGIRVVKIGEFVDDVFNEFGYKKDGNFEVCDLPINKTFFVPSLSQDEKIEWKKIKACVRMKATKELMKIKTKSGRQIVATDAHSFVTRKENKIVPILGSELKIGDRIPVLRHLHENCNKFLDLNEIFQLTSQKATIKQRLRVAQEKIKLDQLFGFFIGTYLSEGCCIQGRANTSKENFISNSRNLPISSSTLSEFLINTCSIGFENKMVPQFAYSAPEEFISGLLRKYFDGNVSINRKMIRAHSNSEELIDGIKLLLTRFGIFAYKRKEKDQFYLVIPYKYAPMFLEKIGSDIKEKREKLKNLAKLAENFREIKSRDFNEMVIGFGDILYQIAKKLKYPTRYVNNFTKHQKIGKTTLYRYVKLFERLAKKKNVNIENELSTLRKMLNSDVVWDEIVEISYVKPSSNYVYDISVEDLETFVTFDGIVTHNTMRTYHIAGTAGVKVTHGLPRLIEIFDAKKTPENPEMKIYLKREYDNEKTARRVAEEIIERIIADVIKTVSLNLDKGYVEIKPLDGRIVKKIVKVIKEKLKNVQVKKKKESILILPKVKVDVKLLEKLKDTILNLSITPIKGIKNAVITQEDGRWVITTIGSNLEEVFKIKEVDPTKTTTTNIHEAAEVLGIEAARNLIIDEVMRTLNEQGLDVDVRHVALVADIMTFTGRIRPIGRYGIAGTKTSVLARAAFEETIKHLVRASVKNEVEMFKGIFENVLIGHVVPAGTGMFELIAKIEEETK